jgi:hypothetical protein
MTSAKIELLKRDIERLKKHYPNDPAASRKIVKLTQKLLKIKTKGERENG